MMSEKKACCHTLGELIEKAIRTRNAHLAGLAADILRHKAGMNYEQSYQFVNRIQAISRPDWEALMYESDEWSC